jgi:hypothetical protein
MKDHSCQVLFLVHCLSIPVLGVGFCPCRRGLPLSVNLLCRSIGSKLGYVHLGNLCTFGHHISFLLLCLPMGFVNLILLIHQFGTTNILLFIHLLIQLTLSRRRPSFSVAVLLGLLGAPDVVARLCSLCCGSLHTLILSCLLSSSSIGPVRCTRHWGHG